MTRPTCGPCMNSGMLEVKLSVSIEASAEDVWAVVGNFNGLPDWHPWVTASILEPAAGGVGRRVTMAGGTAGRRDLTERLVSFDSARREWAYTVVAGPMTFADYVGRIRVTPSGAATCTVDYTGRFTAAPGHTDAEATERIRTFWEAGLNYRPARFRT
jgi:mxaD protein